MGLLDSYMPSGQGVLDDPSQAGILSMALGLLSSSGPSTRPISLGQALGTAGVQGMQTYSQMQQAQQERALRDMQMRTVAMDLKQKQIAADKQQRMEDAYRNFGKTREANNALGVANANLIQTALSAGGGPTVANADRPQRLQQPVATSGQAQSDNNYSRHLEFARFLESNGLPEEAQKYYDLAEKFRPKFATEPRTVMGPGNTPVLVQMADDGTVRPIQGDYRPAEKLVFENTGGDVSGLNPYTGAVVSSTRRTMSPSDRVTLRGQDMTDRRARELNAITREGQQTQVVNDPIRGPLLVNKATGIGRQAIGVDGRPIPGEIPAKREQSAKNVLDILTEVDGLLEKSTGSYAGAARDQAARAFGIATKGAETTAKLKVLEGNLMLTMPRMEGPQSNLDVVLYRQNAGLIGDPTVPAQIKKGAVQTIRHLNEKYAGVQAQTGASAHPQDIEALLRKYGE